MLFISTSTPMVWFFISVICLSVFAFMVCLLEILCFPRVSFPSVCLYITLKHTFIKLFLAIMYTNICP